MRLLLLYRAEGCQGTALSPTIILREKFWVRYDGNITLDSSSRKSDSHGLLTWDTHSPLALFI